MDMLTMARTSDKLQATNTIAYRLIKFFKVIFSPYQFLFLGLAMTLSFFAHAITFNVPSSDSDGSFVISWGNPGAFMELYERLGTSGSWTVIAGGSGASSITLTRPQGTYQYYMKHCHYTSASPTCANTPVKTLVITFPVPSVPGSLSFQNINTGGDIDGNYRLNWGSASGATFYEWRENKDNGAWSGTTNSGAARYVDRSGRTNGIWYYQVRACNSVGCSNFSSVASIRVALVPGIPSSISATSSGDGDISVGWGASTGSISIYDMDYKRDSGGYVNGYDGSSRAALLSGMPIGSYTFRVRGCKTVSGFSSCSGWKYSSVMAQTIGTYQYEYDELGRLIRVVDVKNRETEYDYDAADNRLEKSVEQLP